MRNECTFCFRRCSIPEGGYGWCRMRRNDGGRIVSVDYGHIPAIAVDPVEKKPLYHFLPGTETLSIGASGCSLSCDFCQNWQLSIEHERGDFIDPDDLVSYAMRHGCPSISFTYSEPLVWQDYMAAAAEKAHGASLRTIMVSNGEFSEEALSRLLPLIDAYNIDLKGDAAFYRGICHGEMPPVLNAIGRIAGYGSHIEVTTMLIEGIHTEHTVEELGSLLKERNVQVWHLTRFFPQYRMSGRAPSSEEFLSRMLSAAKTSGIPYIYPGNSALPAPTACPQCGWTIRKHPGQKVQGGDCPRCDARIYGIWE